MKVIEEKDQGMKISRRVVALLLSAALMLSVTGCFDLRRSTVELDEDEDEEQEEAAFAKTSDETASYETVAYLAEDSYDQMVYDAFMEFADSIVNSSDEDEVFFKFERYYLDGQVQWFLIVSYPATQTTEEYNYVDGEVSYVRTLDFFDSNCLSYGLFRELPCMCELYYNNLGNSLAYPSDGRYCGDIAAAFVDGSYLLMVIGDPFILTEEEYNALEVGDVIDCPAMYIGDDPGMTVTDIQDDVPDIVNGWVSVWGLAYPVVIENGEVTSINIEWR